MNRIVTVIFMALLAFGCTINPQDSVPASGPLHENLSGGSGAANTSTGNGSAQNGTQARLFTLEEVAAHDTKADCWMVLRGDVLDLSDYANHPGGDTYVPYCGKDGTEAFANKGGTGGDHSKNAYRDAAGYAIGELGKPMPG